MITEFFLWFSPNCMDRPRMKGTNKNRNKQKNRHHDHLNMLFRIVKSYCLCCCEVLGPQFFSDLTLGFTGIISPADQCLLPNFIPRGGLALPDFPGLLKKSSFKMADSQSKNSNESILFGRNIDQYSLGESA